MALGSGLLFKPFEFGNIRFMRLDMVLGLGQGYCVAGPATGALGCVLKMTVSQKDFNTYDMVHKGSTCKGGIALHARTDSLSPVNTPHLSLATKLG